MEIENNDSVTQAPEAATAQPAATTTAAPSDGGGEPDKNIDNPPPTETPAYVPDFKYKAFGKEYEIDEDMRQFIKDQNTEAKFKNLYARAQGIEDFKQKHQSVEKIINEEYRPLRTQLEEIGKHYKAGDFDTVFEKLGWNQKDIFNWVAQKIRYEDLPPEQKAAYDEARLAKLRANQLEADNQRLSYEVTNRDVQARTFELDQSLTRAEVKPLQEAWDSVYGAGSFRKEVVNTGQFEAATTGKDLSVSDALARVVARVKPLVERLGNGQTNQTPNQPPVRVIPNPQGKGIGAAKKTIKSIADIKRIADSM